jgi:16S rRNA (guanine966-N2)-methyltransferase
MTRIIGGTAGGRRIKTPVGEHTRPTSDRVREALFSSLESRSGSLAGLRVLDLYAGSGALGLEAWSRGAGAVTLVESERRTVALITANARELGCEVARVVASDVEKHLARGADAAYDLVLSDPPYALEVAAVDTDLRLLVENGWLADGATVVVERSKRGPAPSWPVGFADTRSRTYGDSLLWSGVWDQPPHPAQDPGASR